MEAAAIGGTQAAGTERPPTAPAAPEAALAAPEAALAAPAAALEAPVDAAFAPSANSFCRPSTPLTPRQTAQTLFDCRFEWVNSWLINWFDKV